MTSADILLNIGYLTILLALSIKEILWLRITMTIAQALILVGNVVFSDNYTAALWNGVFMSVNLLQIVWLYYDRRPRLIPEELQEIYEKIFNMFSTKEFLYIINMCEIISKEKENLIKEGEKQENLLLMLEGEAKVIKNDAYIATLKKGQFISELSFITGQPASASVFAEESIKYLCWSQSELNTIQRTNPAFYSKFHNILTKDIANKIIGL